MSARRSSPRGSPIGPPTSSSGFVMIKDAKGRFPGNDPVGRRSWGWALFGGQGARARQRGNGLFDRLQGRATTCRPRRTTGSTSADIPASQ